VGAALLSSRDEVTSRVPVLVDGDGALDTQADAIGLADLGFLEGEDDAPIKIVEFSDFACGYCRQFHVESYPALAKEYIATGKVQWRYVTMVLGMFGPNSEGAAEAAECAGDQDGFAGMRDALFEEQPRWKRASDPVPVFRGIAGEQGLNVDAWSACMDGGQARQRVRNGTLVSRRAGVRGTPNFFIVGYTAIPGAIPLDLFRQVLDELYTARTQPTGGGG
jgi:protein-disulfide isomerase